MRSMPARVIIPAPALTIARDGGANGDDRFSIATGGALTVAGGPDGGGTVSAGGNVIASIADTGNGELQISFANNGTIPTTALVTETLRAVQYANASDDPPATASLRWSFSDGNSGGSQGTGGVETVTGTTDITITPVNDAPSLTATASDPTFIEGGAAASLFYRHQHRHDRGGSDHHRAELHRDQPD